MHSLEVGSLASQYVASGWSLVPIPAGTKGPRHDDWNLRSQCINDPIKAAHITGGVGLAHAYSNTCSVDLDDLANCADWLLERHSIDLKALLDAPDAVQITSGRDNRAKLIYRLPDGCDPLQTESVTECGLELRCATSNSKTVQDVLPPSIHPVTKLPYQWAGSGDWRRLPVLPSELLAVWRGLTAAKTGNAKGGNRLSAEDVALIPPIVFEHLESALFHQDADDRPTWIRSGMALVELGDKGREMWLKWSATSQKFRPSKDPKVWDTLKPTSTGYRAVFAAAQRAGWINPAGNPPIDISEFDEIDISDLVGEFAPLAPDVFSDLDADTGDLSSAAGEKVQVPTVKAKTKSEIEAEYMSNLESNIVEIDSLEGVADEFMPHVIDALIPCDEVTILSGHGGTGKSLVALNIAIHAALGLPFGPLVTTQANVLFFSAEDTRKVLLQRVARLCRALGIDPLQLKGKLHLLDASDIDSALYRERRDEPPATRLLFALKLVAKRRMVGLVIVDNASDAFDGDEIKRAQVRGFIRLLRTHLARPSRAVLLLNHVNKAFANGGRGSGSEDYSGSTAWHNSARSRLSLTPAGEDAMILEHQKANYGPKALPIRFEWRGGIPLVVNSYGGDTATEKLRNEADMVALVDLIRDFNRRGERVTTSFQGSYTVFKLLKSLPGFPKDTTSDRLTKLLRQLETDGRICRGEFRTSNRKTTGGFFCTDSAPNAGVEYPLLMEKEDQQKNESAE
jgi:RecA-family ATPase